MAARGLIGKDVAELLGIAQNTLSLKLNEKNESGFTQSEILKLKEAWGLSDKDVIDIFFD